MSMMTRGEFLRVGSLAALTVLIPKVSLAGPEKAIADLKGLRPWEPVSFVYPDTEPAILIDVGRSIYGGVGPKKSIVAYSVLCQHMGCPLEFDKKRRLLICPCHASVFDPLQLGMAVEGAATQNLPQIILKVSEGKVYATGIAFGLVYGRARN